MKPRKFPRDIKGRAISRECPDANCDGLLEYEGNGVWQCTGLTHRTMIGPLIECEHFHVDGKDAVR